MLIGVLSDTHGNLRTTAAALRVLAARQVACVLHCGDIDDATTVGLFENVPAHFVLGNCDVNVSSLGLAARAVGATLHGRFAELELAGRRIAILHGDDQARLAEAAAGGRYDYVFCGHTHAAEDRRAGPTRIINPGALDRARPKTFVLLNLATDELEWVTVAE